METVLFLVLREVRLHASFHHYYWCPKSAIAYVSFAIPYWPQHGLSSVIVIYVSKKWVRRFYSTRTESVCHKDRGTWPKSKPQKARVYPVRTVHLNTENVLVYMVYIHVCSMHAWHT